MLCKRLSDEIIVDMNKKRNNVKSISGFGLIHAMSSVTIVGVISLAFVFKTTSQQDLVVAFQLISYRDQVLNYYTSVASDRVSYINTRAAVADWNSATDIALKDIDYTETLIPSGGLLLSEQNIADGDILPSPRRTCPPIPASGKIAISHFCLKATKTGPTKIKITVDYQKEGRTVAEMANYTIKPRSREVEHRPDLTTSRRDCDELDSRNKAI